MLVRYQLNLSSFYCKSFRVDFWTFLSSLKMGKVLFELRQKRKKREKGRREGGEND